MCSSYQSRERVSSGLPSRALFEPGYGGGANGVPCCPSPCPGAAGPCLDGQVG